MKRLSTAAGWLIAVVLFLFIVSSIVAAFFGPSDASHLSAYLATLGGLMGAVFTAGGLVVALAAVLTLLTVQDKAAVVFREEFDKIRPQLERLSDARVEAHLLVRDAQRVLDKAFTPPKPLDTPKMDTWKRGPELVEQALQLHPQLPNERRSLGLRLARQIQDMVKNGASIGHNWVATEGSFPEDMAKATITWLQCALKANEDPDGQVAAKLALMYGATRDYQAMIQQIKGSVTAWPELRRELQEPDSLMLLSCAVDQELDQEDALLRLNQLLARPTRVSPAAFGQSIARAPAPGIQWLAIARSDYWHSGAARPHSPLLLLVWVTDEGGRRLARAGWTEYPDHGQGPTGIPPDPEAKISPEDLYRELTQRFMLICSVGPIGGIGQQF